MCHSVILFGSASDGFLYLYNRMICDRTMKVLNICSPFPSPSLFPLHPFPYTPSPSSLPTPLPYTSSVSPLLPPLLYTPLSFFPPHTHRSMHIRMMLTQSRLQTRVLRSFSLEGTMAYARCGTGGPFLRHTAALLASWQDTRMESHSSTLRCACPHIHTLIPSLNAVYFVVQLHTHTHALTLTHTHTHMHSLMHTCTHSHMHSPMPPAP